MKPQQIKLYRIHWSQVRKVLIELAGMSPEEAEEERHAITLEAIGSVKSSKDFTQRDLDRVLEAFDAYLVLVNGPSSTAGRSVSQPLARIIWTIESTGLPNAYIGALSQDKFGLADWRTLPEKQMRFLLWTCLARAGKKSKS